MVDAHRDMQLIRYAKPGGRSQTTSVYATLFDTAGTPAAGTFAGSSTAAGVVPTDATVGMPTIESFNGDPGFIHSVEVQGGTSANVLNMYKWSLYDLLFKAGAYNFNDSITLAAQPSFSSRIPGGTDYKDLEIWIEIVTTFTGNPTFTIDYTDDGGVTGRQNAIVLAGAPILREIRQLPLQAGDRGVQKIEKVVGSVASAGTFNVLIMRPLIKNVLAMGTLPTAWDEGKTGCPKIWDDSALYPIINAPATLNTTNPEMNIHIARGTPPPAPDNEFDLDIDQVPQRSGTRNASKAQRIN